MPMFFPTVFIYVKIPAKTKPKNDGNPSSEPPVSGVNKGHYIGNPKTACLENTATVSTWVCCCSKLPKAANPLFSERIFWYPFDLSRKNLWLTQIEDEKRKP